MKLAPPKPQQSGLFAKLTFFCMCGPYYVDHGTVRKLHNVNVSPFWYILIVKSSLLALFAYLFWLLGLAPLSYDPSFLMAPHSPILCACIYVPVYARNAHSLLEVLLVGGL